MQKNKLSSAAIFMYCVTAVCAITAAICFYLWYSKTTHNAVVLRSGIVTFMIVYHMGLRLITGNVTRLFDISCKGRLFVEHSFEKKLYKILGVKKWKGKVPTYNPDSFSLKKHSFEDIANTMAKSEADHWVNEAISLLSILFSLLWGAFSVFLITALAAMLFDAQFIIIQRYNRSRVLRVMNKMNSSQKVCRGCVLR